MDIPRVNGEPPAEDRGDGEPRITCLIDTLAQGGAQRQMTMLATALARRGYDIEVVTYRDARFFDPVVEEAGVPIRRLEPSGKLRRALAVRRILRARTPDVVVAYLNGPGLYAELANLPRRRFGLIVSEFTVPGHAVTIAHRLRLAAHGIADAVVTETDHVRRVLVRAAPRLAGKVVVIRNGVDLGAFRPRHDEDASRGALARVTRVVVLAGYRAEKNPFGMLAAMEHLRRARPAARVELDWYGSTYAASGLDGLYLALRDAVRARRLESVFRVHGPVRDVARLYGEASLLCLPSFYEGCANVICEAAASGVPQVVSDVADNRRFVIDGVTGFLADPHNPRTFADAILRFHGMSHDARREMGRRARLQAESLFDPVRFADSYATLIRRVGRARQGPPTGGATPKPQR